MSGRKKQLVYASVLLLGGLVLVIDRVILQSSATEPSVALGAAATGPTGSAQPPDDSNGSGASSIPEVPFPPGVMSLAPGIEFRNLFALPLAQQRGQAADNGSDHAGAKRPPGHSSSALFVTQHKLQAVMLNPRLRIAIVDDEWMRLGDSVDGCALIGIEGEEARFQCFDGEAVLNVVTQRNE